MNCTLDIKLTTKIKVGIRPSALRPLPHDDSRSVGLPNPRAVFTIGDVGETVTKETEDCIDPGLQPLQCRESHLIIITQRELKFNDLVMDGNSLTGQEELLGSRLQG